MWTAMGLMITPQSKLFCKIFFTEYVIPSAQCWYLRANTFSCLFPVCNLLTHLWTRLIYKCCILAYITKMFTVLMMDAEMLIVTGQYPLGRYNVLFTWVSNSSMMGASESVQSITIPVSKQPFSEAKGWLQQWRQLPSWSWKPPVSGRFPTLLSAHGGVLFPEWLQSCWSVLTSSP